MPVRILHGDCREVLKTLPDASVHCCITSPPYWGLRSYLPEGHPDKPREIGSEPTVEEWVQTMVEVFREVRRVLRDDGTCWVNLGDSYAGSGRGGNSDAITGRGKDASKVTHQAFTGAHKDASSAAGRVHVGGGLKTKDLIGQPWRVAFALQADGWWLRQEIIWAKKNPMPESCRDRFTKAHEHVFLLTKSARYYFDFDAVQEEASENTHQRRAGTGVGYAEGKAKRMAEVGVGELVATRNPRSVRHIASEPFRGAHFATYPPALIEPFVLAGCPEGGTILDPFGGSGTTGLVADRHHRNAILIDLDERNVPMAQERIGGEAPLFTEVT